VPSGALVIIQSGEQHAAGPVDAHSGWGFRMLHLPLAFFDAREDDERSGWSQTIGATGMFSGDRSLAHSFLLMHRAVESAATSLERETALTLWRERLRCAARPQPIGKLADDHMALRQLREYIEANATRSILLRDLQAVSGLSRAYLVRSFTERFGLPPHAYQIDLRIRAARALLAAGHSASHVALSVGFGDQSHLTRHFTRAVGIAPAQFARAAREIR
jgi:AraC-like DNA-binding protein